MLQILLHSNVGELCMVVSRWFGGVKLGTGGLVRAYQDSVRNNLANLPLRQYVPEARLALCLAYAHLDGLRRILPVYEARIDIEDYQTEANLEILLPQEHIANFETALAGISNGSAQCAILQKGQKL